MSAPSNSIVPPVGLDAAARGSGRASTCRSPTRRRARASRPPRTSSDDAVDGVHVRRPRGRSTPGLTGKCLTTSGARAGRAVAVASRSRGLRPPARPAPRAGRFVARARARQRVEVAGAPLRSAAARAARARARTRAGSAARTAARAAGRAATAAGRGIAGRRSRLRPVERAGSSRAAPTCTGAAGRGRARRASPCSTIRPAYITSDAVGDLGDHAEVVGDEDHRRAVLALEPLDQRRGSAPGS